MQGPCPLVQAVLSDSPGFTRFVCSIRFVLVRSGSSVVRSGSGLVLVWFWLVLAGSVWFGAGSVSELATNHNEPERTRTNQNEPPTNQSEPERTRTNQNER